MTISRPRSENESPPAARWTKVRSIVVLRLTLVITASYLLLVQTDTYQFNAATAWLILAALASNIPFRWLPQALVESTQFGATLLIVDTIWITALLLNTNELGVDFYVVYFFVLFLAAVIESLPLMTLSTFLVTGAYLYSVWATRGDAIAWSSPTLIRLPFFFAVAAVYGFLAERVRSERRTSQLLLKLARRDPLTDLPNRRTLEEKLEAEIYRALRNGRRVALLMLDLDEFKYVNDTYGHTLGDEFLIAIADRLRGSVRRTDVLGSLRNGELESAGRLGGDEFAVVLSDIDSPESVAAVAQRLRSLISEPVRLEDLEIETSASVGIAVVGSDEPVDPGDAESIGNLRQQLLIQADRALYRAKEEGRNIIRFHDPEMEAEIKNRVTLGQDLRAVLDREELFLEFQPQIDLGRQAICGAEALLRWQHPERGLVPPNEFIPIAESSGQIQPIGEWVLRAACRRAVAWRDYRPPGIPVAVNLSAVQFRDPDLPDLVARMLDEEGLSPDLLELELTEGIFLKATPRVTESLWKLHDDVGLRISLDDFGRGFSSLEYLRRFPIDKLKVDQLFVSSLDDDPDARVMVGAIIALAKSLGLGIVAEGVETESQLEFLRLRGCEHAQGYYFSRPISSSAFTELLGAGGGRLALRLGARAS